MKRITYMWLAALLLTGLTGTLALAQSPDSLADYARNARKDKKTTAKQFDNDNLPKDDKLSIVGQAPADSASDAKADDPQAQDAPAPKSDAKSDAKPDAKSDDSAKKPSGDSNDEAAARQRMYEEW